MPQNDTSNVKDQVSGTLDAINGLLGLLRMVIPGAAEDGTLPKEGEIPKSAKLTAESETVADVSSLEQIQSLSSRIDDLEKNISDLKSKAHEHEPTAGEEALPDYALAGGGTEY